jgi:phosphoribosylamine--glycine ligase
MRVLVVGGGGREHAFVWALEASPMVDEVYCAPGNPGIAALATGVDLAADDTDGLVAWARGHAIDLVVVGPEQPLAAGLVDALEAAGLRAFGPSRAAARLESSKAFARAFGRRHGIPGADHVVCGDAASAHAAVDARGAPVVVKADGLAAGKGVVVAATLDEAHAAVDAAFTGAFGDAGAAVLVEQCLVGTEASLFALCDGTDALAFGSAQDHKRLGDGDTGPNTGGMGAYSPAPVVTGGIHHRILKEVMEPAVAGMAAEGHPFRGFLYAGLMIRQGRPRVLEFNVRLGDPEAQPLMMRLRSDPAALFEAAAGGRLAGHEARWDPRPALCVVQAAEGYPGKYAKGQAIEGLAGVPEGDQLKVFHAGTARRGGGPVTAGGRVLGVTALGADLAEARDRALGAADGVRWPGVHYRRDIGHRALGRG